MQAGQDPTPQEWIIIATERQKRPQDFRRSKPGSPGPEYEDSCLFCPGNESRTSPEALANRESRSANTPGWRVRVVPNKFYVRASNTGVM